MATQDLTDRDRAFLTAGTRTGKLAYTAADGRPLVAPVWFIVDDGDLVFTTERDCAKGRALRRDPRAALVVDDENPPYSFVQVQGIATLDDDPSDLLAAATKIAARYMGPALAEQYGKRNAVPEEMLVRLTPTRVVAGYDIAD